MNRILTSFTIGLCLLVALLLHSAAAAQNPVGTAFTYQGRLKIDGVLWNSEADFCFKLYDAPNAGNLIDSEAINDVDVIKGLFSVQLNFDISALAGEARWLEISVRTTAGPADCVTGYSSLNGRQPITPTPYATHALTPWESDAATGDVWYTGGHVGIGTASPQELLDLLNPGGSAILQIRSPSQASINYVIAGQTRWQQYAESSGNLYFRDITGSDRLTLTPNGNVGIGATSPAQRFVIQQSANTYNDGLAIRNNPGTSSARLWVDDPGNIRFDGGSGNGTIIINGDATNPGTNGRVGINIDPGSYALHVNGPAGKPGGGSWSNSSDARLKKDTRPLEHALDRLLELRGVTYEWIEPAKHGNLTGTQIGMIAQDVEPVFPQWVGEDSDGYKTLGFMGFEALTVEALRDVTALLEEKDAQLAAHESQIAQQQQTLDQLRAEMTDMRRMIEELARVPNREGARP
jgi:hypothetical protein